MDAIAFLKLRKIFVSEVEDQLPINKNWPIDYSKDAHVKTANDLVSAMEDYAKLKIREHENNRDLQPRS